MSAKPNIELAISRPNDWTTLSFVQHKGSCSMILRAPSIQTLVSTLKAVSKAVCRQEGASAPTPVFLGSLRFTFSTGSRGDRGALNV